MLLIHLFIRNFVTCSLAILLDGFLPMHHIGTDVHPDFHQHLELNAAGHTPDPDLFAKDTHSTTAEVN